MVLKSLIVDINGVIGGTTARKSLKKLRNFEKNYLVGNNTRITKTTEIKTLSEVVVGTEQLDVDLRDTVHGGGSHDGLIGSHDLGSRGTEGTNGGGDVKTELVLAGNLDDVLRTVDVDLESLGHENSASEAYELRVLLTNGGEKGSKVDDPGDAVVDDNLLLRE